MDNYSKSLPFKRLRNCINGSTNWQEEEEEDITCKAKIQIMVDGGINKQTLPRVKKAGADILVAGSFLFRHEESIRAGAEEL